ncbi:MAG TPA: SLBB domain-containing protein, partial [Smithellaceae bacterium]|nr:SLBB domain-containing protein [Smithellaceae bacterium]
KALEGDPAHNVKLAPNDRLLVKTIADYETVRFVSLSGQVMFPGRYPFKKGERLSDLLNRAGGFTPHAYLRGAYFTRASARTLQQKGLTEMVDRLEREIMAAGAGELATALSPEEIAAKKAELEQRQKFMNTLKNLKATGRMTIYLADAAKLKNTEYDFELEDGDALHVPEKNNVVNVVGSVMSHGSHLYSSSLNYQDYIDQAGGYSYYADPGNTYVLKVDGSARKISRTHIGWNSARSRWEMTAYGGEISLIEPGDTIVVPEKFERIAWLREIKDISTILMNIAAVTAVMIAAF